MVNTRTLVRLAAPALFLAGFTIAVLLVRAGLSDDAAATTVAAPTTTVATTTGGRTTARTTTAAAPERAFATVGSGDTLDQIALENDTTVERLLELNPDLDPNALQIGQRVRVR